MSLIEEYDRYRDQISTRVILGSFSLEGETTMIERLSDESQRDLSYKIEM